MAGVAQQQGDEGHAIEFSKSTVDFVLFGVMLFLFAAGCVPALIKFFSPESALNFRREFGAAAVIFVLPFLVFAIALWVRMGVMLRGVIVFIGPDGIFDRRISEDLIPWSKILKISRNAHGGYTQLRLYLDPSFESQFQRTLWARVFLKDRFFGGYRLLALGLKANNSDLYAALTKYRTVVGG